MKKKLFKTISIGILFYMSNMMGFAGSEISVTNKLLEDVYVMENAAIDYNNNYVGYGWVKVESGETVVFESKSLDMNRFNMYARTKDGNIQVSGDGLKGCVPSESDYDLEIPYTPWSFNSNESHGCPSGYTPMSMLTILKSNPTWTIKDADVLDITFPVMTSFAKSRQFRGDEMDVIHNEWSKEN